MGLINMDKENRQSRHFGNEVSHLRVWEGGRVDQVG